MVLVSGISVGSGNFVGAEERATEMIQGLEKSPCRGKLTKHGPTRNVESWKSPGD